MCSYKCLFVLCAFLLVSYAAAQQSPKDEPDKADSSKPASSDPTADKVEASTAKPSESDNANDNRNNFSDPRFATLFNRGSRRPRPIVARHVAKPKPTLPSFIRNTPSLQPVTFAPTQRPDRIANNGVVAARAARTTAAPIRTTSSRSRSNARTTSTTTTPSPSNRRSRAREQLAASGQLPDTNSNRRKFGGVFKSTTPRSRN